MFSEEDCQSTNAMEQRRDAAKVTMLTAYFALNAQRDSAKKQERDDRDGSMDPLAP